MAQRSGQAGVIEAQMTQSPTVGNITDGDTLDVNLTADANFIGARTVRADFNEAVPASLGIVGAWVSNAVTGVVTVRFCALGANWTSAAVALKVTQVL